MQILLLKNFATMTNASATVHPTPGLQFSLLTNSHYLTNSK
jgi:hypothetical protein